MRHAKHTFKIGRTGAHRRSLIANMLKSLIENGRVKTTVTKAKELRRHADRMVTLAKRNTLHSKRQAASALMLRYNVLSSKEARAVKKGDRSFFNTDRKVMDKLFGDLSQRFATRNGGYTRIIKGETRIGDNAPTCILEFLAE